MRAPKGQVNVELDRVMAALTRQVKSGKDKSGLDLSLMDKLRLLDRVLKWEAIKAKMDGEEWGAKFSGGQREE